MGKVFQVIGRSINGSSVNIKATSLVSPSWLVSLEEKMTHKTNQNYQSICILLKPNTGKCNYMVLRTISRRDVDFQKSKMLFEMNKNS